ncbi:phage Gp37/Gp68 family protein [Mesorhizobium sp. B2-1-3A]|uniref:DUF5131 family protein n=1 Tax=Mesorhizobium sp. B2-1-3A TaxID=2589971 RepID=UPI0011287202|nr:phage Gp37/Gp68 family protein [Mesorhizobium sp. B2-1-3A]TPM92693.1 phage Gp37/Gp68 family protein [Mesorhizobium sp. B2-1-3A]
MADKSPIEWTDATWNPVVGCSIVSPGCTHCYAMKMAGRIEAMGGAKHYAGTTKMVNGTTVWTGKLALAPEKTLLQPLAWRAPRRIFVNSMGDLFHEDVPDEWIDRVFAVMALAPLHTFQVLTKRAKRMREYLTDRTVMRRIYTLVCEMTVELEPGIVLIAAPRHEKNAPPGPRVYLDQWPLPNVWLGVSAERQQEADERIPDLLATPAAIRFVSAEPLLGKINFRRIRVSPDHYTIIDALDGYAIADAISGSGQERTMLDWIIVGGESGPGARGMHPAWARSIRDQCNAAGTAFFFKQWGAWAPSTPEAAYGNPRSGWRCLAAHPHVARAQELYPEAGAEFIANVGKKAAGRLLDGVEHNGMPEMREVPAL